MRKYIYILLFSFCFSFVQLRADNFSYKTDVVSFTETKIYPNPVVNGQSMTITGEKEFKKIEVINIVGNEIYAEKISPSNEYKLSIERLDKGMYLLKILYTDNTSIIKRFWVK